jgi:MFS family permease
MSTAAADAAPWPKPAYGWYAVALLMSAYALGVVDRIVIGLLVDPIRGDLGLSNTEMGVIQGVAFGLFYACFALPVGLLVDRYRRVPVLAVGLTVWSFATMACGFAGSFAGLFAARVAIGAGESTTIPGSSSLVADLFTPARRGKAFGIFNMGGSVGIGIAYLLGGAAIQIAGTLQRAAPALLGELHEWQLVFMIVGAPGLLLAALMALTLREPPRRGAVVAVSQRISLRPLWQDRHHHECAHRQLSAGLVADAVRPSVSLATGKNRARAVPGRHAARHLQRDHGRLGAQLADSPRPSRRAHSGDDAAICGLGDLRHAQVFGADT